MIIKNIRIIDPAEERDEISDIFIADGKIVSEDGYRETKDEEILDGTGIIAGPGFVDVHVHFRDPGQTRGCGRFILCCNDGNQSTAYRIS